MKEYREYRSPADWVEATARPYKAKYFELELMATPASRKAIEARQPILRQQAAILKRHIQRLERLA
jgi:hypothetical protein